MIMQINKTHQKSKTLQVKTKLINKNRSKTLQTICLSMAVHTQSVSTRKAIKRGGKKSNVYKIKMEKTSDSKNKNLSSNLCFLSSAWPHEMHNFSI